MNHKIAYWLAMWMILIGSFILYYHYGISSLVERILILSYMIVYGALMARSVKK